MKRSRRGRLSRFPTLWSKQLKIRRRHQRNQWEWALMTMHFHFKTWRKILNCFHHPGLLIVEISNLKGIPVRKMYNYQEPIYQNHYSTLTAPESYTDLLITPLATPFINHLGRLRRTVLHHLANHMRKLTPWKRFPSIAHQNQDLKKKHRPGPKIVRRPMNQAKWTLHSRERRKDYQRRRRSSTQQ